MSPDWFPLLNAGPVDNHEAPLARLVRSYSGAPIQAPASIPSVDGNCSVTEDNVPTPEPTVRQLLCCSCTILIPAGGGVPNESALKAIATVLKSPAGDINKDGLMDAAVDST